jgi:hypothetical protein
LPVPPELEESVALEEARLIKRHGTGMAPEARQNLLGLSGVINQIRLTFDGTYSLTTPYGVLVVEKI